VWHFNFPFVHSPKLFYIEKNERGVHDRMCRHEWLESGMGARGGQQGGRACAARARGGVVKTHGGTHRTPTTLAANNKILARLIEPQEGKGVAI